MEPTNSQSSATGRAQGQSVGANAVVGHNMVLLSSLDAHKTGQEKLPSCKIGDEVNSHPAIRAAVRSSNDMTKFEQFDDRVGLIQRIALAVSIL
jgi:hypothetical protein